MNTILSFWLVFKQVVTDLFRNIKTLLGISIIQGLAISFVSLLIMLIIPKSAFIATIHNNRFWGNFFAHQEHVVQFVMVIILYFFEYIIMLLTYTGLLDSIYVLKTKEVPLSITHFFRSITMKNVVSVFGIFVLLSLMSFLMILVFTAPFYLIAFLSKNITTLLSLIVFLLTLIVPIYVVFSEYCLAPYIFFEKNYPVEKILEESRQRTKKYKFHIAGILILLLLLFTLFIFLPFGFVLQKFLPNIDTTALLVTSYLQQKFKIAFIAILLMFANYFIQFFFVIFLFLTVGEIYKRLSLARIE